MWNLGYLNLWLLLLWSLLSSFFVQTIALVPSKDPIKSNLSFPKTCSIFPCGQFHWTCQIETVGYLLCFVHLPLCDMTIIFCVWKSERYLLCFVHLPLGDNHILSLKLHREAENVVVNLHQTVSQFHLLPGKIKSKYKQFNDKFRRENQKRNPPWKVCETRLE